MTEDPREKFVREREPGETALGPNLQDVPDRAKLRAALFNFVKQSDVFSSGASEEPDMEEIAKRWGRHMKDLYGGSWILFLQKYSDDGREFLVDITTELYENHEPFREEVDETWKYNEMSGNLNGGTQKSDSESSDDAAGIDYTEIKPSKLNGYLMMFVRDRDSIIGDTENVDLDVVAEEFDKWMCIRLLKRRAIGSVDLSKLSDLQGGDLTYVKGALEDMYSKHEEFNSLLNETWSKKEKRKKAGGIQEFVEEHGSTERGNGKKRRKKKAVERKQEEPSSISSWSEKVGSVDSYDYREELDVNRVIQGDSKEVMMNDLPRNCVDMVITSPPYWAVRDYEGDIDALWDDGEWVGQLGHEPTPDLFVEHLIEVFRACKRVLKPSGSLWVNIDDTYGGVPGGHYDNKDYKGGSLGSQGDRPSLDIGDSVPQKCQAAVPERLVLRMLEEGWYKRNTVHWAKQVLFEDDDVRGATKPSAVKDRFVEKSQEYLFFFTQGPDYYFDLDVVRRPHKTKPQSGSHYTEEAKMVQEHGQEGGSDLARDFDDGSFYHEKGGNLPVVWQINPARSKDEHYAPYPDRMIERPILAACPEGGVVLDPFFGTGTTGRVAEENNRNWIGIELSDKYVEIARSNVSGSLQTKIV